ncbi:single-stranded-DNA-specific exonuclease RecJ [Cetobacterium somerae ATCC BAA-474]|uniref:Single-stranded-DNA-specific exonuclease RecJ n=2 Tax=Cetobacterium TaxID=180162 RepID=U7V994_9FUSO|nr:single-stranded-DNA-specific exonuclease RecJ [Cetobacterium somerae]ERT67679.1 single-stranded-DNA-specific exonuclease RecJ [Cetobacterium somerae ATCC BAA-474]WVJ00254.1 single-stranded-DNA-specific exonuclease RecJ [Cetobacterium somerae]
MRNTKWIFKSENFKSGNNNIDKEIEQILYNRGIQSKDEVEFFINGTLENLMNPSDLSDVDKGVERILKAKENNETIWIYGDYDVDGITSTSLCYLALKELEINVKYYIPLRDEGYGLNKDALNYIKEEGGNLIITVDCGISSISEVEHCNALGMDMIITDHHEINNELPPAHAIINPKREDNKNSYKYFAGVGTAFMLLLALYKKLDKKNEIYKYLDIVAIGTIADIVPLKGENRLLVKRGLELLKSSKWQGLNMLMKRLFENPIDKKFDTYDVGFIIAPIFNAAGRLEDAKMAVELFVSNCHITCDKLIYELINKNSERKEIQEEILKKAIDKIENEKLDENSVIVVAEKKFHHGVIGIVASKILDRYYKPTIIMEIKPLEGIATASCRSTEAFNMIEALNSMRDIFIKYGGHAGAAGFSIAIENIEEFSKRINEYAVENLNSEDTKKPIKIDCELSMIKISFDLMDKLSLLEPYGFGNASPMFAIRNCKYTNFRAIGKEKNHLMMDLIKNGVEMKNCVWFNSEDMLETILNNKEIDVAFKLKMETYKDKYQYKIFIEDIKPSKKIMNDIKDLESLYNLKFPIKSIFYTRRDLENEKLNISFINEEVSINIGRNSIGFLDNQTKLVLKKLNDYYGYKFNVEIDKIIRKDENYNVHIWIDKDDEFKTLSFETGKIFKEIKEFLIGDLEYNSLQKKVLKTIFKDKKNVVVSCKPGRGMDTVVKTIEIYYKMLGKKVLIVKEGERREEGYDFYIYMGNEVLEASNYNLFITNNKIYCDTSEYIEDDYKIPSNVEVVDADELEYHENIFSIMLPLKDKKRIIESINKGEKIFTSEDIKIIL